MRYSINAAEHISRNCKGKNMKLIIDCLGGDNSPEAQVEAAILAIRKRADLSIILVGDEKAIRAILDKHKVGTDSRVEIVHAPGVITGNDKPIDAIRLKKDSSMVRAISMLREDESIDGMVSCGATGALIAAATLRIPRIEGVRRPALCPILPSMTGGIVGICDSGANVDTTPEMLQQFAVMGSRYLEAAYRVRNPRVALLNVGVEEEKGDDLRKDAYKLLKKTEGITFVGNMEAREALSGEQDLIICDGFSGNVLCKSIEGTALELLKKIKNDIYSRTKYKMGALLMKKMFQEEKEFMNYQNYGGSVLLGSEKVVVKGHGSAERVAVRACIDQAYRMIRNNMNKKIGASISACMPKEEK